MNGKLAEIFFIFILLVYFQNSATPPLKIIRGKEMIKINGEEET